MNRLFMPASRSMPLKACTYLNNDYESHLGSDHMPVLHIVLVFFVMARGIPEIPIAERPR
jgi:hypothetical protein